MKLRKYHPLLLAASAMFLFFPAVTIAEGSDSASPPAITETANTEQSSEASSADSSEIKKKDSAPITQTVIITTDSSDSGGSADPPKTGETETDDEKKDVCDPSNFKYDKEGNLIIDPECQTEEKKDDTGNKDGKGTADTGGSTAPADPVQPAIPVNPGTGTGTGTADKPADSGTTDAGTTDTGKKEEPKTAPDSGNSDDTKKEDPQNGGGSTDTPAVTPGTGGTDSKDPGTSGGDDTKTPEKPVEPSTDPTTPEQPSTPTPSEPSDSSGGSFSSGADSGGTSAGGSSSGTSSETHSKDNSAKDTTSDTANEQNTGTDESGESQDVEVPMSTDYRMSLAYKVYEAYQSITTIYSNQKYSSGTKRLTSFTIRTSEKNYEEKVNVAPFLFPLSSSDYSGINSTFGWRTFNGTSSFHRGIDIGSRNGKNTPIYSVTRGIVVTVKDGCADGEYYTGHYSAGCEVGGNRVVVESYAIDGNGNEVKYSFYYLHMEEGSIKVKVGDIIDIGTKIGGMGTSGISTGYHLHLGMSINDSSDDSTKVDPYPYLQKPSLITAQKTTIYTARVKTTLE